MAFDHGGTETAIFRRKKTPPTAAVKVGANTIPFNKEAQFGSEAGKTPSLRSRTTKVFG